MSDQGVSKEGGLAPMGSSDSVDRARAVVPDGAGVDPPSSALLSYSRLSKYQRCGEAYRLQYVAEVPQARSGAAAAGSAVHSVIEEMINDGWFANPETVETKGKERFFDLFDYELRESGAVFIRDDQGKVTDVTGVMWGGRKHKVFDENTGEVVQEQMVINGEPIFLKGGKPKMRNVLAGENYHFMRWAGPTWVKRAGTILRDDAAAGVRVAEFGVERRVTAWLDEEGGVLVQGYIDVMILAANTGEVIIRDWKTGTYVDPMQLANYGWLLENLADEQGRTVSDVGQIIYLRGNKKEDWIKEYDLREWKPLVPRMYRDAVAGIDSGHFALHPSSFCGSCWVKEFCDYGKTLPAKE